MANNSDITAERVRQIFSYDASSGSLVWSDGARAQKSFNRGLIGKPAGGGGPRAQVKIAGRMYLVHRLIWLFHYGEWPNGGLDHINCDPADNRVSNLREASKSQNGYNRGVQRDNKLGIKGVVYLAHCKRYHAQITVSRVKLNLGYYKTIEEAKAAYCDAVKRYHGEYGKAS